MDFRAIISYVPIYGTFYVFIIYWCIVFGTALYNLDSFLFFCNQLALIQASFNNIDCKILLEFFDLVGFAICYD